VCGYKTAALAPEVGCDAESSALFVIHRGADTYDVITGYKLNEEPLDLADANRLARRSSASVVSVAGSFVGGEKP
jgi:hypothetical protein